MEQYFITLATFCPLVVLVSEFLIRVLKIVPSWLKQVLSWGVAFVLAFAAMYLGIGFFAGQSVVMTVVDAFAAGLVANGIFDIKFVQMFLDFILKFLPKPTPTTPPTE